MLILLLLVLLILALGGMPVWPYSATWGWTPSAAVFVALLVLILLLCLRPAP